MVPVARDLNAIMKSFRDKMLVHLAHEKKESCTCTLSVVKKYWTDAFFGVSRMSPIAQFD